MSSIKRLKTNSQCREIRGLRTVNCGEVKTLKNIEDPIFKGKDITVEILRPNKHNPEYQIICYYYYDDKIGAKVEVTLYRCISRIDFGSEVYFFKNKDSLQHYRSMNYNASHKLPKKYRDIVYKLYEVLNTEFN